MLGKDFQFGDINDKADEYDLYPFGIAQADDDSDRPLSQDFSILLSSFSNFDVEGFVLEDDETERLPPCLRIAPDSMQIEQTTSIPTDSFLLEQKKRLSQTVSAAFRLLDKKKPPTPSLGVKAKEFDRILASTDFKALETDPDSITLIESVYFGKAMCHSRMANGTSRNTDRDKRLQARNLQIAISFLGKIQQPQASHHVLLGECLEIEGEIDKATKQFQMAEKALNKAAAHYKHKGSYYLLFAKIQEFLRKHAPKKPILLVYEAKKAKAKLSPTEPPLKKSSRPHCQYEVPTSNRYEVLTTEPCRQRRKGR